MKYSIATLIIILIGLKTYSQCNNLPTHGTIIVGVICEDGILLCADSRASFSLDCVKENVQYAYIDSCKKIFKIGKFQVGLTGFSTINNIYWEDVIEKYNKKNNQDSTVEETFNNFKLYLNEKLHIPDSTILRNSFMLAGYEKNKPVLLIVDSSGRYTLNKVNFRAYSDARFRPYYNKYSVYATNAKGMSDYLSDMFQDFYKEVSTVGGPIFSIKINMDNSVSELSLVAFKRWKSYKAFEKSILSGETTPKYIYERSKSALLFQLKYGLKHPKSLIYK